MGKRKSNILFNERIKEIKEQKIADLSKWFGAIENYVKSVLVSTEQHGLILEGSGGFGKSTLVESTLVAQKTTFKLIKGYITPLELYHKLVEYRNDIIFIDDCDSIFKNKTSVSILKSALESINGTRIIQYNSSTNRLHASPSERFNGKIIMSMNEIPKNLDTNALISRCIYHYFDLTYAQKIEIMTEISKLKHPTLSTGERKVVLDFIQKHSDASIELNLRTQKVLEGLYTYAKKTGANFEDMAVKQLVADDNIKAYLEVVNKLKSANVTQQVALFTREYGLSRRTFFRIKKKVPKCHDFQHIQIDPNIPEETPNPSNS